MDEITLKSVIGVLAVVASATTVTEIYGDPALVLGLVGGAFAGAVVGLGASPPKSRADALMRGVVTFICGAVVAPLVMRWFQWPMYVDVVVGVTFLLAAAAWFVVLMLRNFSPKMAWMMLVNFLLRQYSGDNNKPNSKGD